MCNITYALLLSRPARGAWIEMAHTPAGGPRPPSRPARGAWIEMSLRTAIVFFTRSRPARGAWIEIGLPGQPHRAGPVAPREGRVD